MYIFTFFLENQKNTFYVFFWIFAHVFSNTVENIVSLYSQLAERCRQNCPFRWTGLGPPHGYFGPPYSPYLKPSSGTPVGLAIFVGLNVVHGWVDPWVGLGRYFSVFSFWWVGLGWVHQSKTTKNWKDYVTAFKARLDKIWLHWAVKFDFEADLTGTGNRLWKVTK